MIFSPLRTAAAACQRVAEAAAGAAAGPAGPVAGLAAAGAMAVAAAADNADTAARQRASELAGAARVRAGGLLAGATQAAGGAVRRTGQLAGEAQLAGGVLAGQVWTTGAVLSAPAGAALARPVRAAGAAFGSAAGAVDAAARQAAPQLTAVAAPLGERAGALAGQAGALAAGGRDVAGRAVPVVAQTARNLADIGPRRHQRRVWARRGHAAIEVRGQLARSRRHRQAADAVCRSLQTLRGVRWAEVNAVTAQVLVAFDEQRLSVPQLVAAVEAAEKVQGLRNEDFSWSQPEHPSDGTPFAATGAALAADLAGVAVGIAGRVARIPPPHPAIRVPLSVLEGYPRARQLLERRIGPLGTDVLLAVGNAAVYALSEGPDKPAVDACYRLLLAAEMRARAQVWDERGEELCFTEAGTPAPAEPPPRQGRPVPLPPGPGEKYADRAAAGSMLAAAGVLAATRDPGRAANALLAGVPRAARLGREGFAAVLGRELARHGMIPMDRACLRRLDRVSVVIIDSAVLCTPRPRVLGTKASHPSGPRNGDAAVWRAAAGVLRHESAASLRGRGPWSDGRHRLTRATDGQPGPDSPEGMRLTVQTVRGRRLGEVTVGCELDPLAEAVLAAARAGGARLLLTRHASTQDLLGRADAVTTGDLTGCIRGLQGEGEGVLLVARSDGSALAAADVSVACPTGECAVCWSADLISGPGLADVWRLLQAAARARTVSERGVTLAAGGTALGTLLAAVSRGRGDTLISPVQGTALASLVMGAATARSAMRAPLPPPVPHTAWHAMDPAEVLARLEEAAGGRAMPDGSGGLWAQSWQRLAAAPAAAPLRAGADLAAAVVGELRDPLTPVLVVGAAASAMLGSGVDSALVGGVMLGNAVAGGLQRLRTERALEDLLLREQQSARRLVRSAGDELPDQPGDPQLATELVPATDLSPGDVITLRPDDVVPADARLLAADALEVDESTLTGESLPVTKDPAATVALPLADRTSMLYEGTTVLAGTALAVVVATGEATEAGRAGVAASGARPAVGVQARLGELTRIALPVTGLGGLAVTALGMLRGAPLREALSAGVAVAVAAVPEGLPLVATVAQLAAARRLSAHGVLVRSTRTLEALGRVDVLCFDKTGTLTEGRLEVTRGAAADGDLDLGGDRGRRLLTVAARACPVPGEQRVTHATDRAVLAAAEGLPGDDGWQLLDELPFQGDRGYSAAVGRQDGELALAVKGAPEVLLGACSRALTGAGTGTRAVAMTAARRRAAREVVERLAADGLRVLAVAEASPPEPESGGSPEAAPGLIHDLTLVGFVAIADVMRPDASAIVADLGRAGVRSVMITGDHPATASAIARKAGISDADEVVTGAELDALAEAERRARVGSAAVFARVSPEQKVRIVADLRRAGHVVAMTGDGTNDAAAIRLADVGIGVAARGSTAARGASDLVLPGTDIARLADALREGRALWRRVREAVSILVGGNAGEVAFMVAGTAVGGRSPLNTRQLLLVNMLTDMFPALAVALGTTAGEEEMAGGPAGSLLGAPLARAIAVRGGATALGATMAWAGGRMTGRRARASTMGLAALVATQLGQTLLANTRSPVVIITSVASAGALVLIVNTPGVSQFFGCTPLGPAAWGMVAASSAAATAVAALAPRFLPAQEADAGRPPG